jgi:hypothetical protein
MLLASGNLSDEARQRIGTIYPIEAAIHPDEIAIYEFNEVEGTATVLDTYHGLPSDENFLNRMLEKTNEDFAELLEIQQEYD